MSEPTDPHEDSPEGTDVDPGEPIAELADLRESPPPAFIRRVVDGVDRRLLGGAAMDLPWFGLSEVILEYLTILFGFLGKGDQGGDDEEK